MFVKPKDLYCGFNDVRFDSSAREYFCGFCGKRLGESFREEVRRTLPQAYVKQLDKQAPRNVG